MLNCAMWVLVWFRSTFQECPKLLSLVSESERTSGRPLRGSRFLVITVMGFSIEIRAWTSISILREEQGSIINMGLSQIFLAIWSAKLNHSSESLLNSSWRLQPWLVYRNNIHTMMRTRLGTSHP